MIEDIKKFFFKTDKKQDISKPKQKIEKTLDKTIEFFQKEFDGGADLIIRKIKIFNSDAAIISVDGMINKDITNDIIKNITNINMNFVNFKPEISNSKELYYKIRDKISAFPDQSEVFYYEDALNMILIGCAILVIDGQDSILVFGVQGFEVRSISEPTSEKSQRGSREGFVEVLKLNMTLIRRRIANPKLKFETMQLGSTTKTYVSICYMNDRVEPEIINKIKSRLEKCDIK